MGVRYHGIFTDSRNSSGGFRTYRVLFDFTGYAGSSSEVRMGSRAMVIDQVGSKEDLVGVVELRADFEITNGLAAVSSETFFTENEKSIRCTVQRMDPSGPFTPGSGTVLETIFVGYVTPRQSEDPYHDGAKTIRISASDGIAYLKNEKFITDGGYVLAGINTWLFVFKAVLDKIGLTLPFTTVGSLRRTGQDASGAFEPMAFTNHSLARYASMTYYEVLQIIATHWNARIVQHSGEWWMLRLYDLPEIVHYRKWAANGDYVSGGTYDNNQTAEHGGPLQPLSGGVMSYDLSVKKLVGNLKLGGYKNQLGDTKFEDILTGPIPTTFLKWSKFYGLDASRIGTGILADPYKIKLLGYDNKAADDTPRLFQQISLGTGIEAINNRISWKGKAEANDVKLIAMQVFVTIKLTSNPTPFVFSLNDEGKWTSGSTGYILTNHTDSNGKSKKSPHEWEIISDKISGIRLVLLTGVEVPQEDWTDVRINISLLQGIGTPTTYWGGSPDRYVQYYDLQLGVVNEALNMNSTEVIYTLTNSAVSVKDDKLELHFADMPDADQDSAMLAAPDTITTSNWITTGDTTEREIVEHLMRERLAIYSKPPRFFDGDIWGHVHPLKGVELSGEDGIFVPLQVKYDYAAAKATGRWIRLRQPNDAGGMTMAKSVKLRDGSEQPVTGVELPSTPDKTKVNDLIPDIWDFVNRIQFQKGLVLKKNVEDDELQFLKWESATTTDVTDYINPTAVGFELKTKDHFAAVFDVTALTAAANIKLPNVSTSAIMATDETAWMLGGNTIAGLGGVSQRIGTLSEHDVVLAAADQDKMTFVANGGIIAHAETVFEDGLISEGDTTLSGSVFMPSLPDPVEYFETVNFQLIGIDANASGEGKLAKITNADIAASLVGDSQKYFWRTSGDNFGIDGDQFIGFGNYVYDTFGAIVGQQSGNLGVRLMGNDIAIFTQEGNFGVGTTAPLAVIHGHANVSGAADVVLLRATNQNTDYFFSVAVNPDLNQVRLYNSGILRVKNTWQFDANAHFAVNATTIDATASTHVPSWGQVQALAATGIKYGEAVKTVATTNISLSGTQTINGYAAVATDRVLLTAQTTQSENGVWIVAAGAWTRATDSDSDAELRNYVYAITGGTYSGWKYKNSNNSAITVDTTALTYIIFDNNVEADPVFTAWKTATQNKNLVWASSGTTDGVAPAFRSLVAADIPVMDANKITTGDWQANIISAAKGGTGIGFYAAGDLIYASGGTVLNRLPSVAFGNVLLSGNTGLGAAPFYGKVGLTTHIEGVLGTANGGTGSNTRTWVDLTSNENVGGTKTFLSSIITNINVVATGTGNFTGGMTSNRFYITPSLTYNSLVNSTRIQAGSSMYYDYKPLVFTAQHFVMERGNLKLGGLGGFNATGTVDFATERLEVEGNIRYSGTLKPANQTPTANMWLKAPTTSTNAWAFITSDDITDHNAANKLLKLNSSGFIDSAYLPAFIDDVLEFANLAAMPLTGEAGKIYVALDSNKQYRWSGSSYVQITDGKATWGGIDGTLSAQTDLQAALDAKANLATNNTFTGINTFSSQVRIGGSYGLRLSGGNTYNGETAIVNNLFFGDQSVGVYTPAHFKASKFMFTHGFVKFGGTSSIDFGVNWPSERVDIDGNIRISGVLKPDNIGPAAGSFLKGVDADNMAWASITVEDIEDIATTYQAILPEGSTGQLLGQDASGLKFLNLEINPLYLGNKRFAVGTEFDNFGEVENLTWENERQLRIGNYATSAMSLTMGFKANDNDAVIEYQGLGDLYFKATRDMYFENFTGGGNRMLAVTATGRVYATTIPSGGGGIGSSPLTADYIGFGDAGGVLAGSNNFKWVDGRFLRIQDKTAGNRFLTFGINAGATEAVITSETTVSGALGLAIYAPSLKIDHLKGGGSTQMLTIDNNGIIGRQAIPSGGGGAVGNIDEVLATGSTAVDKTFNLNYTSAANRDAISIYAADEVKTSIFFKEAGTANYGGKMTFEGGPGVGQPDPTTLRLHMINAGDDKGGLAIYRQTGNVYIGDAHGSFNYDHGSTFPNKLFVDGGARLGKDAVPGTANYLTLNGTKFSLYLPSKGSIANNTDYKLRWASSDQAFYLVPM